MVYMHGQQYLVAPAELPAQASPEERAEYKQAEAHYKEQRLKVVAILKRMWDLERTEGCKTSEARVAQARRRRVASRRRTVSSRHTTLHTPPRACVRRRCSFGCSLCSLQ